MHSLHGMVELFFGQVLAGDPSFRNEFVGVGKVGFFVLDGVNGAVRSDQQSALTEGFSHLRLTSQRRNLSE